MDGVVRGVKCLIAFEVRSVRLILNCVYASLVVFFVEQAANFSNQFHESFRILFNSRLCAEFSPALTLLHQESVAPALWAMYRCGMVSA